MTPITSSKSLRRVTAALQQRFGIMPPVSGRLLWGLFFVSLMAVRMNLPFHDSDLMAAHGAIADSLSAGQNWGRQALMGALDFPPLPTLALLLVRHVPLVPEKLAPFFLVAFAQAWSFSYILRLATRKRDRLWVGVCTATLAALPTFRATVLALDPNWITTVPATAALFHVVRWSRARELRDALLAAVCSGVLAFGGPAGVAAGLALLIALRLSLDVALQVPRRDRKGAALLLWAPFAYAVALLFVGNWLILDDPIFFLRRLAATLAAAPPPGATASATLLQNIPLPAAVAVLGNALALGIAGRPRRLRPELALLGMLVVLAWCRAGLEPIRFLAPGVEGLFFTITAMSLALRLVPQTRDRTGLLPRLAPWALPALALLAGLGRPPRLQAAADFRRTAPYAQLLTFFIDRYWQNSRVLVYGVRAPTCYPDIRERRFLHRLDFREGVVLEQARQEQLYLLVPPADGIFYPLGTGGVADLHRNGRPWLLLERTWPPGWQLWRCVVPPAHESRLRFLGRETAPGNGPRNP
ncbi:MAG: hypothetical protein GXP31_05180 [Kiritimatiellaeota bacterium]|nr:hypothetical protein [Kiritimatiellota bacterium]